MFMKPRPQKAFDNMAKSRAELAHSARGETLPGDTEAEQITRLLERWSEGHREALDRLIPAVYSELKRIASGCLEGERPGATLQVTALVHDAYLRLVDYREPKFKSRKHFYVVAAQVMRRILVDHATRRDAQKRRAELPPDSGLVVRPDVDVLDLDDALNRLAASDPEKARLVELRYFGGLSIQEVADITGTSPAAGGGRASDVSESAPPRFNHGVRALQLREGQQPAQDAHVDQCVDLGVHVFHARVGQHDRRRLGVRCAPTGFDQDGHTVHRRKCLSDPLRYDPSRKSCQSRRVGRRGFRRAVG
jgi:RNA polymerase sigma factor (TIGR02999 family)